MADNGVMAPWSAEKIKTTPPEVLKAEAAKLVSAENARQQAISEQEDINDKKDIITFSSGQELMLVNAGFEPNQISGILEDINLYGKDRVIQQLTADGFSPEQITALENVIAGKTATQVRADEEISLEDEYRSLIQDSKDNNLTRGQAKRAITSDKNYDSKTRSLLLDILEEVYGGTWLQNIIPGGRGEN